MDDTSKGFFPRSVGRARAMWALLSLGRQLALVSTALVLLGMSALGFWLSANIEQRVKLEVGERGALYMGSFVAPLLQELASQQHLSPESVQAIDLLLARDAAKMGIMNAKIWAQDGTILYGMQKQTVGHKFQLTPELIQAWNGQVEVDFDDVLHLDHVDLDASFESDEAEGTDPLFEIYVPIRQFKTMRTIAVGEFYQDAAVLKSELAAAKLEIWATIAFVTFSVIGGLITIALRGSRNSDSQRSAQASRLALLSNLLKKNESLRRRSMEDAELNLRRLGSDLHDGPGQSLALALLKLNQVSSGAKGHSKELESVRGPLNDAMTEIRDMSAGMVLPEIEKLQFVEALKLIILRHERHTSTSVACTFPNESIEVSHPVKLCLCRFVQEALSNAFRHAGGIGQSVKVTWTDKTIVIEVSDRGPGFEPVKAKRKRQPLGLIGLKNRLESLGGQLTVHSEAGEGTTLVASLPINSNGKRQTD